MNTTSELQAKAAKFAALHCGPRILVLANAWDAASARIFEVAGFPAIATTSGGVANAFGRRDGEQLTRDEVLGWVRRIVETVSIPVSADMEAGFGASPEAVADTARAVMAAGAVGMNLEDAEPGNRTSLYDVALQVEKIKAVREAANAAGVEFVLNARTDVYLRSIGEPSTRLENAIRRANAYHKAGATSLFVPGVIDRETIGRLAREIQGPINIIPIPGCPTIPELEKLGVRRVSIGSGAMRATMGLAKRVARELLDSGTYTSLFEGALGYPEINELFPASNKSK